MNSDNSISKIPREDTQKSQKKYQAFEDISKYFSKEEWEKLSYSEKISYVYMKRNYTTMSSLGFNATLPPFMEPKEEVKESLGTDSDEGCSHNMEKCADKQLTKRPKEKVVCHVCTREMSLLLTVFLCDFHIKKMDKKSAKESSGRKERPRAVDSKQVAVKTMCPPAEESASGKCNEKTSGKRRKKNIWTHRLRERKNLVVYEEISDPEEEDDEEDDDEKLKVEVEVVGKGEGEEEEKEEFNAEGKESNEGEKYSGGELEKYSEDHSGEEYNEEEDYNEEDEEYSEEESDEEYFVGEYEDNDDLDVYDDDDEDDYYIGEDLYYFEEEDDDDDDDDDDDIEIEEYILEDEEY
ncbi:protein SSX4-like [Perognathus longimembris pacificus]|uniref:protein SSX4-like n=1 Tax=Perognathus longimembris pacificus TaxID=214514 RepID=UPI0020195F73|nr:protein SSX4-like [Perognathus longimembris pacificus]